MTAPVHGSGVGEHASYGRFGTGGTADAAGDLPKAGPMEERAHGCAKASGQAIEHHIQSRNARLGRLGRHCLGRRRCHRFSRRRLGTNVLRAAAIPCSPCSR
jgi:hypothetical protein